MKAVNKSVQFVFAVPLATIQFEGFEETNANIVDELESVDWDEQHRKHGIDYKDGDTRAEDTFITLELVPSCKPVLQLALEYCNDVAKELTWDIDPTKTRMRGFWAHMTKPDQLTAPHRHLSNKNINHLSGVYYVRTPKACGNIVFSDDRFVRSYEPAVKKPTKLTSHTAGFAAKEGLLIIFPSWLTHRVGRNNSNETRISLSFNASLEPSPNSD